MKREELLKLGFKELPHLNIGDGLLYNLERRRYLSVSNVGEPNEFLYLCETNEDDRKEIIDLICLHNYDFDGYLTIEKVKSIIFGITGKRI